MIIYRVHKDTDWHEVDGFENQVPDDMVLEDDFLAGKVCSPDKAKEWYKTYSRQCECVQRFKTEKLMKSSEITEGFKQKGFQNFVTEGRPPIIKDAYECALEYFQEYEKIKGKRTNSIALIGRPGSGKTHLLSAVSNNLINRKKVPVLYFPYVEGFNDLKDDFDQLETKLARMKKVEVLFIDDLFKPVSVDTKQGRIKKPRATEWQVEQMYAVINHRYLNNKAIIISSELDYQQILDIDEAIGSRIYEMCADFMVNLQGENLNYRLEGMQ